MPCHFYFEGETLRIDFVHVVNNDDFTSTAALVENLEKDLPKVPHRIADLTGTSGLNVDFPTLFAFADHRKLQRFPNAFKSAIVAPQVVHLGVARMFQTLNQHPQIKIEIFSDLPAAQAWIAQD